MMMRLQDRDCAGKGLESVARSHQGDTQHAAAADAAKRRKLRHDGACFSNGGPDGIQIPTGKHGTKKYRVCKKI